jgi:hypothetical protein
MAEIVEAEQLNVGKLERLAYPRQSSSDPASRA